MIYFLSDTHFGHMKSFLYEPRGFDNIYDHDKTIIENWNKTVNPDDDIFILGDIMLGDNDYGLSCLKQLKGNIHIIRGNHDSDTRLELYNNCWNVVEVVEGKFFTYEKYHFYLSHYPCLCSNYDEDKPLRKRTVSLCGHTHTSNKWHDWDKGLIYHVDADAHNCTPISIEEIINDLKEKLHEI